MQREREKEMKNTNGQFYLKEINCCNYKKGYMSLFYAWIKEKAKLHYWFLKFNY